MHTQNWGAPVVVCGRLNCNQPATTALCCGWLFISVQADYTRLVVLLYVYMYTHYAVSVVGLHRFSVGTATKQANKNHQHFLLLLLHEQLSSGLWSVWFGNELIPCYVCPRPFRSTQQSVLPFDTEHCNHIGLTTFTHPPFQSHYPTLASKKLSYLGVKFRMRMCSSATVKSCVAQLIKHRSEQHTHTLLAH